MIWERRQLHLLKRQLIQIFDFHIYYFFSELKVKVTLYTVRYYNLRYSLQNPWLSDNYCTFIEIYNLDLNDVRQESDISITEYR